MTVTVDTPTKTPATSTFVYGETMIGEALMHQTVVRRAATRAALVAALSEVLL